MLSDSLFLLYQTFTEAKLWFQKNTGKDHIQKAAQGQGPISLALPSCLTSYNWQLTPSNPHWQKNITQIKCQTFPPLHTHTPKSTSDLCLFKWLKWGKMTWITETPHQRNQLASQLAWKAASTVSLSCLLTGVVAGLLCSAEDLSCSLALTPCEKARPLHVCVSVCECVCAQRFCLDKQLS